MTPVCVCRWWGNIDVATGVGGGHAVGLPCHGQAAAAALPDGFPTLFVSLFIPPVFYHNPISTAEPLRRRYPDISIGTN